MDSKAERHASSARHTDNTIGRCYSHRGRAYTGTRPSKQRVERVLRAVSDLTERHTIRRDVRDVVDDLNRLLRGWANYFRLGPVGRAYRAVDTHTTARLRRWLCRKHKQRGRGTARYPDKQLYEAFGLIRVPVLTRRFPWANA